MLQAWLIVTVVMTGGGESARPVGVAASTRCEASSEDVAALQEQIAALRRDLAIALLKLQQTMRELEELRAFMAAENAEQDIERWKAERAAMADQRAKLAAERLKLEETKRLVQATARQALDDVRRELEGTKAAPEAKAGAGSEPSVARPDTPMAGFDNLPVEDRPRWDADYRVGLMYTGGVDSTVYVSPRSGKVIVDEYPDIDRKNILIEGTFENKSKQPWRYTFEFRVSGRRQVRAILLSDKHNIIGSARYQTPVLEPGELHRFTLKVPVTNVAYIEVYELGNMTADRPGGVKPVDGGK